MPYSISARLAFSYPDPAKAKKLLGSIEPDNGEYLRSRVEGNELISEAEGESILSMRATLDDFLACLGTAEKVMREKEDPPITGK